MTASARQASSHVHARFFSTWTMQHRAAMSDLLSPSVHALSCLGSLEIAPALMVCNAFSGEAARLKSLSSPVRCAEQGGRYIPQPALGGGRAHVSVPMAPLSQARHLWLPLGERSSLYTNLLSFYLAAVCEPDPLLPPPIGHLLGVLQTLRGPVTGKYFLQPSGELLRF